VIETLINGRWPLLLPEHRAERSEWPWWEAGRLAAMWHHLGPGDVVYDVGAEEGDLPALWASWGCDVVLVEPNPRVWPNIRAIWQGNGFTPLGFFVGFAGPEERRAHVPVIRDGWPECAFGALIGDHGFLNLSERPDVDVVTIDRLAGWTKPPTAITIDVEGAELQVLLGARMTLEHDRPKVWVSVHPDFMRDGYGDDPVEIIDLMESHGYERTFIAEDHEEHWMFLPR
jgi:FkbM family methyltransferase